MLCGRGVTPQYPLPIFCSNKISGGCMTAQNLKNSLPSHRGVVWLMSPTEMNRQCGSFWQSSLRSNASQRFFLFFVLSPNLLPETWMILSYTSSSRSYKVRDQEKRLRGGHHRQGALPPGLLCDRELDFHVATLLKPLLFWDFYRL